MIELPNGQKVPDWATEETQQKLLDALTAITKGDKKTQESIKDLVESAAKGQKQDKENAKEADQDRDKQLNALREISANTENNANVENNVWKSLKSGAKAAGGFAATVGGAALAGLTTLLTNSMQLGAEFSKLQMVGVGLDTAGMSALNLSTSLTALGMSSAQTMELLNEYSSTVQSMGRQAFINVNKTFADLTGSGSKFGLTLSEAAEVLAEDLELRQQLGILQQIDTNKQAQLSAQLFEQQLQATTILGKSIDDIRGASKQALADNATVALRMKAVTANMSAEEAAEFTTAMQKATGDLAAVGLDQGLINSITEAAMAPVAFMGDSGAALNKALTALDGIAGSNLKEQIIDANAMLKEGNIDGFKAAMGALDKNIVDVASSLSATEFEQLQVTLLAQGQAGEALAMSLLQADQAAANFGKTQLASITNLAKASATFSNATNALSSGFDLALNQMSGAISGPMASLAEAFSEEGFVRNENNELVKKNGEAFRAQEDILDKNGKVLVKQGEAIKDVTLLTEEQKKEAEKSNSVFTVFREAMERIRVAFSGLFGTVEDGTDSTKNMADMLRDKLGKKITEVSDKIVNWIKKLKPEDIEAFVDSFMSGLETAWTVLEGFGTALSIGADIIGGFVNGLAAANDFFVSMFGSTDEETGEKEGNWATITATLVTGLAGLFAMKKLKDVMVNGAKSMFGKMSGGGANAAQTAAGSTGGGVGKGIAGLGKGIGKGIGGILGGLAKGLGSLGSPKVLLGVATLAGLGLAMEKTIAPGFKAFTDLDWETMGKAIVGLGGLGAVAGIIGLFAPTALLGAAALGAIGLALQLFPTGTLAEIGEMAGSVFSGIAEVIGTVFNGIGSTVEKVGNAIAQFKTAGAEAEAITLDAQASAMERLSAIPTENLLATSDAVNKLAASMSAFGDAVGDDGFMGIGADGADVDKQNEQIGVFAKFAGLDSVAIMNASDALGAMSESYAKFASLDASQLTKVSEAMLKINDAASPDLMDTARETITSGFNTIRDKLGFGSNDAPQSPAPNSEAVMQNTPDQAATAAQVTPEGLTKDGIAIVNKLEEIKTDQRIIFNKLGKDLKTG